MSSWIKSQFFFDDRMACFTLSRRDRPFFDAIAKHDDIDALERTLLGLIEKYRPDLKGATLHSVSYEPCMMAWNITLSHPSLAKVKFGELIKSSPLMPDNAHEILAETTLRDYGHSMRQLADKIEASDEPVTISTKGDCLLKTGEPVTVRFE